jgi:hypothetical protein
MHVRVETDNHSYGVGRAAPVSMLVHGTDPGSIQRELAGAAKLRNWHQTKTTFVATGAAKQEAGKCLSSIC